MLDRQSRGSRYSDRIAAFTGYRAAGELAVSRASDGYVQGVFVLCIPYVNRQIALYRGDIQRLSRRTADIAEIVDIVGNGFAPLHSHRHRDRGQDVSFYRSQADIDGVVIKYADISSRLIGSDKRAVIIQSSVEPGTESRSALFCDLQPGIGNVRTVTNLIVPRKGSVDMFSGGSYGYDVIAVYSRHTVSARTGHQAGQYIVGNALIESAVDGYRDRAGGKLVSFV